ncbi:MAG: hypothetical protein ABI233_11850 [Chthoniobacterales bacterium]
MNDPKSEEEKHPTPSTTSEPQEEFIEQKAEPSRDEKEVAEEAEQAPPKGAGER